MTRPHIIRADSIDLQDTDAPSAKNHSHPHTYGSSLAPHQAETLREVAQETADENHRSPRVSWSNGDGVGDIHQYADDLTASVANKLNGDHSDASARTMQQQPQDSLAVAQNGGVAGHIDESDADGDTDESLDDDMMDKISSSPSIEDEDIDFEFVYALHTFVATVEGQANATKGDTMVLLDDSNSYWWLVRVVKDSSIGYLPAEHIETPTERLARLNKHRNIDLSATMLGDQPGEKSKSTFRSALRGKKKKTVVFAEPTYVDYSDPDFSSDEEDVEELFGTKKQNDAAEAQAQQQSEEQQATAEQAATTTAASEDAMVDETAKVEPLKPKAQREPKTAIDPTIETVEEEDETRRSSEQFFESKPEGPSRSRNGTVRNTDSFFKDETVETKKITLTPNLLRDDNQPRPSTESVKDLNKRPSLDKMDKMERELQPDKKEDKKKKDKKPGAIRSFFSRKDKKKSGDDDSESIGKRSMDIEQEHEDDKADVHASPDKSGPQRNPSKLQKQQPRPEPSPTRKVGAAPQKSSTRELAEYIASEGRNDVSNVPPSSSMRIIQEQQAQQQQQQQQQEGSSSPTQRGQQAAADPARPGSSGLSSKMKLARSASGEKPNKVEKPQKVIKAKSRTQLDDFDSSDDDISSPTEAAHQSIETQHSQPSQEQPPQRPTLPGTFPDSYVSAQSTTSNQSDKTVTAAADSTIAPPSPASERLSDSPIQVSPIASSNPPALMGDTSSQEDHSSTKSPSPELINADEVTRHQTQDSMTSSTSTGASQASSTWNDAKLRAFFDSSSDIRDMLMVVYDKNDVIPAGPDHPVVGPLFREQNAKLAEITTQLDNMLGDWLARKQRLRGTV